MMRPNAAALALAIALCGLAGCTLRPPPDLIGTWNGDPPGPDPSTPESVTLSLYGQPAAAVGHYEISLLIRAEGADPLTRQNVWSGRWSRSTALDNGHARQVIVLHDVLADAINQYAVGPGNTLQPTSAYLHRQLSAREIALFTLQPLPGSRALPQ